MRTRQTLSVVVLLIGLLLAAVMTASAQTTTQAIDPNANISWPPPVYVLRGEYTIRGSANLPNMTNWYLEFQALPTDGTAPPNDTWTPVTLPTRSAVRDGVLGIWDTTSAPEGLYTLRLNIGLNTGSRTFYAVSPLRIENNPPPFAQPELPVLPTQITLPTLIPTPTAFDTTPRATANRNANVRQGDGTNYSIIGNLQIGDTVPIVGISALGTGWYLIVLPDGRQGWVAPSVVDVTGDFRNVPRVQPPPPPATPTPAATATPVANINLVAGNFRFDPSSPNCNQTFNIYIDVANFGTAPNPSGFISVQDFRRSDGTFQTSTIGAIPVIQPGQTVNVGPIPLTVATWYNEEHRLLIILDPSNAIPETNEGDNVKEAIYLLNKAACP